MTVAVNHHRDANDTLGPVVVRCAAPDPFEGLRGLDYIKARGLNRPVQRVQKSAQQASTPESK